MDLQYYRAREILKIVRRGYDSVLHVVHPIRFLVSGIIFNSTIKSFHFIFAWVILMRVISILDLEMFDL